MKRLLLLLPAAYFLHWVPASAQTETTSVPGAEEPAATPPSTPVKETEPQNASPNQEQARKFFSMALSYVEAEDYVAALSAFHQAQELAPHHTVLFNIGLVYEKLYEPEKAIESYTAYLEAGDDSIPAAKRDEVEGDILRLRAAAAAQKTRRANDVIALKVSCPYPGFVIETDGETRATSPVEGELYIPRSAPTIVFRRLGFEVQELDISHSAQTLRCEPKLLEDLAGIPTGTVEIRNAPDGALAQINGFPVPSGVQIELPLGEHLVEVRAPHHASQTRILSVKPGFQIVEGALESTKPETLVIVEPGAFAAHEIVGIAVGGVGVALLGTSAGIYIWNDGRHRQWQREHESLAHADSQMPLLSELRAANDATLQDIQQVDNISLALALSGVVLAAGGAATYFWNFGDEEQTLSFSPSEIQYGFRF